ncbi:MAG TPA: LamG-like jellyroll fold domain-containing protein [Verrucomicrobiae bacterium]|nr:LamG-like jellyroll fold domain-containing protein [Verrucomicrobiae bacterium]
MNKLSATIGLGANFKSCVAALLMMSLALTASAGTLKFNGTNSHVAVENSVAGLRFPGTNAFTIEAWVKPNTLNTPQFIVSKYNGGVWGEYYLAIGTNGRVEFHREAGPNFILGSSNTIPMGIWTHVAVTYTSGTRRIYLNGQLDPVVDPGSGSSPAGGPTTVIVGARYTSNVPSDIFNGDLDELRIWNTARSIAELQQNMRQRLTGAETNLLLYYPADESGGARVPDFSGHGFSGLLQNGAVVNRAADATQPVALAGETTGVTTNAAIFGAWTEGYGLPTTNRFEFGAGSTALRFDGVNDYINITNSPSLANQSFSVEFWARRGRAAANDFLFSLGTTATLNNFLLFGFRANNQMTFAFFNNDLNIQAGGDDLLWHHWAFTFDSVTKQRRMYRDGVLVGQDTSPANFTGTGPLRFGHYPPTSSYFNGALDDFRIWTNAVLTASTIRDWMFRDVNNTHPNFNALGGYWKFDEAAGNVINDSSGNGRTGVFVGDPLWRSHIRPAFTQTTAPTQVTGTNAALDLNGSTAYVDVPDDIWFNGDFTVEFKTFVRSYSSYASFLDFGNGPDRDNILISLGSGGTGTFQLWSYAGAAGSSLTSPTQVPLNQWVNLAVTLQGNQARLYSNGVLWAQGTVNIPLGVLRTNTFLGRPNWLVDTYPNAIMDDVRIWNVARTASEIRDDLTQAADPTHPNLLLNYRFDGDSGTTVVDSRANAPRHGTMLGSATRVASPAPAVLPRVTATANGLPVGVRHYYRSVAQSTNGAVASAINSLATLVPGSGTALDFDGGGDAVRVPGFSTVSPSTEVTVEFWMKARSLKEQGTFNFLEAQVSVSAFRARMPRADGSVSWDWGLTPSRTLTYTPPVSLLGNWHHFAFVSSVSGNYRRIYRNGILEAEAPGADALSVGQPLIIGRYASGSTAYAFDGELDEFRVWNVARSPDQIRNAFNERLIGSEPGLVAYYRMDDGGSSAIADSGPNNLTGLFVGRPEWSPSTAFVSVPIATTTPMDLSDVGFGSAELPGTVYLENSLPGRYWFEYGAAGHLDSATPELPLPAGDSFINVSAIVSNLGFSPNYSFRLVAANDHGTNYGNTQLFYMPVPGAQTALQFDGVNDRVIVGNSTAYKASTNLTVEAWIYPTGPGSGSGGSGGIIVNKEGEYELARYADGTLRWAIANTSPGWFFINTGVIAPLNQWMHVALVYDGSTMRLYTNGALASATNATGNITDAVTGSNDLQIGARQVGNQFFQGAIDDVRVWLVARSESEIAANFNRRLNLPQTGLAAWLLFDEGFGLSTVNLVNAANATLTGGPIWIPSGARTIHPLVNTLTPSPVLATSATLRGLANPSGEALVTYFEYGPTIAYGTSIGLQNNPASLANVSLSAALTGLDPGTTYHYRLVGYNTTTTNYGANQTFTTLVLGSGWPVSTKLTGGEASVPLHVLDGLGNTFVAGTFSGSASFKSPMTPSGGATANAFIGKMSRKADWLWAVNIPASSNGFTLVKAMGVDSGGNVYVAGQFSGTNSFGTTQLVSSNDTNLFVAKLDSFGTNWLWARSVGGVGTDTANALAVIGTNIFVAGNYSGTATFGSSTLTNAGSGDIFVASLDSEGNWLWASRGGGTGGDFANALAVDSSTNLYIAGHYSGTATIGSTSLTNAGGTDLFVAKLTPTGAWVLARRGGSANNDSATAITRNAANEFYLAGQFGGTADFGNTLNNVNMGSSTNIFVLKLNTEAAYQEYTQGLTQGSPGNLRSVAVDSLGRVYVAGDFPFSTTLGTNSLISSGNSDVFVAQLIDGDWTWAQKIGSAGAEMAGSISAGSDNSIVVSGTYQGTIQIGYVALSTPNNRDIFVARLDANRVYEHNNYIVGQEIPVPLDAQDPAYNNGAIGQPFITILEKDQPDSDALNSFAWSIAEHKLFPLRQVTAIFKWPLTTNPTNTSAVVTAVGRISYPTNPVIYVANAPAELEPATGSFPLKFLNLAFTTINGAAVDASTKLFTAAQPGWSVLHFLDTGGQPPNPAVHPSKFEVVRTVNWNDPQHLTNNQTAIIGTPLTHPTHSDPAGKNGFVYFTNAFYDGVGDERAYDRPSRTGPILPVNKDTASASDDLVVVWYRTSANGIGWPSTPVQYVAEWPVDAAEIVLASRLGSGALSVLEYPSKRVYNQPDKNLPGFNPNEEHAALYGDTLYALRNDLNNVLSPKASEPYTLLKYLSPDTDEWAMKVFKIVTTNATFPLTYNGVAGSELLLPEPLTFLNLCNLSNRVVAGPGFQDYLGRLYARAAGPGDTATNIVARYWYPLQPDFFYDLNLDGTPDAPVGTCVPWLDRRPGGIAGTPVDVTYNVTWPINVPTLQIGETLLNAKFGLPDIRKFAAANVVYDQGNPFATNAIDSFVRLFDPLSARTLQLATNFTLPATIVTANDAGKRVFASLPYSLRSRLRYDDLTKQLSFAGLLDESLDYGGPANPLLLINVLSPRERDRIKQLSTDTAFVQAIDQLYDLTRNPNRIDRNGDNLPDQELLIGFTAPNLDTNLNIRTGPLQTEDLGDLPKVLTAGLGTGTGFITVVENNDSTLGLPVKLHVIRVADGPFRGDIKVLYPDNVFDEKLTLRHSADFGGEPQRFEFEWYYMPDDPSLNHTNLPTVDANGNVTALNDWTPFPSIPAGANGFNDITIGDGAVGGLLTLADNWFLCRYRGYSLNGETNWTDWVGVIGGDGPQLAEGWVKRVVFGLNPFEARTDEFHENETVTFASMLQQAGARYEGDIAFNPDGDNINNVGLISAYQTVLNRAKNLSIDATPGINFPPANNALLLAASRIADFYMLLGNEAYADAADPTIGFRTDNAGYGTLAPSIFTFQNQLDSLLEEELVLLRGRDDRSATVRSAPAYNRLFWNFTHGEGEVAYAQAYNITDQNSDGFITADDARIMYPQGHGDAWGHYLTATKTYYSLLQNTNFDWIARSESILLAGVPVVVDYLDERKFARAAAAKAKTGAELVDLTYRINYVDDPAGQYQGYKDTDANRAWGLSEWAHRAGSGAFFDWVVANAILPATDPNTNHVGIQKIDRTTVVEVNEILAGYENVQGQLDRADSGLNPLGLTKNVVPFDIDPSLISAGKTHFEQIYDRAIETLNNTVTVFNHANQLSQALRGLQDNVNRFSDNVSQQERDYKNRLIELFGYPYAGDIGAGRTYPAGYDGPDLYHYMYVNSVPLNGEPALSIEGTVTNVPTYYKPLFPKITPGIPTIDEFFFSSDLPANTVTVVTQGVITVNYPLSSASYGLIAPANWGERRAPGELQQKLSELLQSQARLKQALANYDALLLQINDSTELLEAKYALRDDIITIRNRADGQVTTLRLAGAGFKIAANVFTGLKEDVDSLTDITTESLPKVLGVANDATAPARGLVKLGAKIGTKALRLGANIAEGAAEMTKTAQEDVRRVETIEIEAAQFEYELQQKLKELEQLIRQEPGLRLEALTLREAVSQSVGNYQSTLARGVRLIEERVAFRKNAAAETQASRYQDMTFRIFRNDAIQKYRAQFDLAAQYVFLAAVAYDFETQLLGDRPGAGRAFLTDIIRQRALGEVIGGVPVAGRHGLADPLARLNQNFGVLKGQLGFNNPQTETGRFSIRHELFRLRETSHEEWRAELKKRVVPDLWQIPEFRRYCRPFAPESAGPQPGLVIRFPTTITFGLNYFGWPLGGGDSAYDSTLFATKVRSAGVWFENYLGSGLSQTPRVYLIPVGADIMRSPSGNDLETREWRVVDQKIPVPFPIGFSSLNNPTWIPLNDSLSDTFADIRRFSSFRAYHDSGVFNPAEATTDSRLIGRSVWNTDWMLIIPGGTFLFDANQGLDTFINTVGDIKIFYQTYSYSGN